MNLLIYMITELEYQNPKTNRDIQSPVAKLVAHVWLMFGYYSL